MAFGCTSDAFDETAPTSEDTSETTQTFDVTAGKSGAPVVVAYPAALNAKKSKTFSVKVNGTTVPVEEDRRISFAQFAFAGEVTVEVKLEENVNSFTLSPEAYNIDAKADGKTIKFSLKRPRKLILHEVNGGQSDFVNERRLFLFADPIHQTAGQIAANKRVRASDLKLDTKGEKDETAAIQQAIDDLSASGGGMLVFEAGLYKSQSIFLRDDVTVYLEGGARLQASNTPSPEDGFIKFYRVDNARLMGPGSVDANGIYLRYQQDKSFSIIRADEATNCRIQDVTLLDPAAFAVWVRDSDRWTMYNTKQIDFANKDLEDTGGEDGVDPDASRNFLIENSFIYAGDDAVAIKGITPTWPLIDNITLRNNVVFNSALGAGLGMGSQLENTHFENITFENNDVVRARFPVTLAMREFTSADNDAPLVESVQYRNNRFGTSRGSAIFDIFAARSGVFRDVLFHNMVFEGHQDGSFNNLPTLETAQDGKIKDWTFDRTTLYGRLIVDETSFEVVDPGVSGLKYKNTEPTIVTVRSEQTHVKENGGKAEFVIRRSGDLSEGTVVYFTYHGSAKRGVDFEDRDGFAWMGPGQEEEGIKLVPIADSNKEGVESVVLSLTNRHSSDYMIGADYHAMIAIDDR